jgi:hypothetical protein
MEGGIGGVELLEEPLESSPAILQTASAEDRVLDFEACFIPACLGWLGKWEKLEGTGG